MAVNQVHIIPNSDKGGWDIKRAGNSRASKHTDTKAEAKVYGKTLAKNYSAELVEHNKNGKIISKDSYGNDPIPPRDTEH